uniref:Ig-like domain-containing protein n=1 Tax=Sphaeramia orbicularis TaxID=375764 RepID=A0A672ZA54_9TELE
NYRSQWIYDHTRHLVTGRILTSISYNVITLFPIIFFHVKCDLSLIDKVHISVMWRELYNNKLIVHKYGSGQPDEQDPIYTNRTEMKKHWLRTGDFSVTLKHPTDFDTNGYVCIVYNKNKVLRKKQVVLERPCAHITSTPFYIVPCVIRH